MGYVEIMNSSIPALAALMRSTVAAISSATPILEGEPEYPHGAPGRLLRIVWVDVKISVAVRCQLKSFAPSLFSYDNLVDGLVLHSFSGRRDGRNFAYRGGSRLIREDRFVKSRHMAENCSDMKFLAMLPPMCGFVLTVHWLHSRQI